MKKKINIVILLFAIILWGTVIYRFSSQYLFTEKHLPRKTNVILPAQLKFTQKDTFKIPVLIRDPFLDLRPTRTINYTPRLSPKRRPPLAGSNKKATIPLPDLAYYGYIKSAQHKEELGLFKVDGKMVRLKVNQEVEGLKLHAVYKDSAKISFKSDKITIERSK